MTSAKRIAAMVIAVFAFSAAAEAAQPYTPYKDNGFLVVWDNHLIAGVSGMSPLARTSQVVASTNASTDTIQSSPGTTDYVSVTFERGLSSDLDFENWAALVAPFANSSPPLGGNQPPTNYTKNVKVELIDLSGNVVRAYILYGCWPSGYQALSRLDYGNSAVVVEAITLQCNGWARDQSVTGQ